MNIMTKNAKGSCMRVKGIYFWYTSLVGCLVFLYGATFMGILPTGLWKFNPAGLLGVTETKLPSRSLMSEVALSYKIPAANQLDALFATHSTSLSQIRLGERNIPKFYLARLPRDLDTLSGTPKKEAFLQALLPLISKANQGILNLRSHLISLQEKEVKEGRLTAYEMDWLEGLYQDYRVSPKQRNIKTLLARVDVIPVSLTLAQAIIESGWGTSGLAQKSNSLFGHTNGQNEMIAYDDLSSTVEAYVTNLNRHAAYQGFRNKRLAMREKSKTLDPYLLADGLSRYSERGMAYVRDIKKIIQANQLTQFDHITHSSERDVSSSHRTV